MGPAPPCRTRPASSSPALLLLHDIQVGESCGTGGVPDDLSPLCSLLGGDGRSMMTAVAPITALRIKNVRRSTPGGTFSSGVSGSVDSSGRSIESFAAEFSEAISSFFSFMSCLSFLVVLGGRLTKCRDLSPISVSGQVKSLPRCTRFTQCSYATPPHGHQQAEDRAKPLPLPITGQSSGKHRFPVVLHADDGPPFCHRLIPSLVELLLGSVPQPAANSRAQFVTA